MSPSTSQPSAIGPQRFSCVCCGATEGRRRVPHREWSILRCSGCGLRRTWPAPDPARLQESYDDVEYYDERWRDRERPGDWENRAREVLSLLGTPQASILDFGAGHGGLVAGLRASGVQAEGVEPSEAGRRLARDRGVVLHPALPSGDHRFTAVTMLHVLEHVADPVATLAELRAVLAPGGRLLVEVPNVTSVDALWPPMRPLILDLPFHLHHFTPKTLVAVVVRAGFTPVLVRRFNPLVLEWALSRRHPRTAPAVDGDDIGPASDPSVAARPQGASAFWHRALPRIREALPGAKLQLVASA